MVQIHSGLPFAWSYGALAQLGEHLLCKQGVIGSIPIGSTNPPPRTRISIANSARGKDGQRGIASHKAWLCHD